MILFAPCKGYPTHPGSTSLQQERERRSDEGGAWSEIKVDRMSLVFSESSPLSATWVFFWPSCKNLGTGINNTIQ